MSQTKYDTSMPIPAKVIEGISNLSADGKGISPSQTTECDLYATEVLGNVVFAPWLYLYTCSAGEFREGWIPGGYFHSYVSPAINGEYGRISQLAGLPKRLFDGTRFPDLLYQVNGFYIDRYGKLVDVDKVRDTLFNESGKIFFKVDGSSEGKGIHIFDNSSFDLSVISRLGNGVFQKEILQHRELNYIVSNSVSTMRLVTVSNDKGIPELRASYLRVGRRNDRYVSSNSQIAIPVGTSSGRLGKLGYFKDFTFMTSHPDTGFIFKDVEIPQFRRAVSIVLDLHRQIPYVRMIGWDVAINKDEEVELIEWNAKSPAVTFIEATMGPRFNGLGWENLWKCRATPVVHSHE